MIQTSSNYQTDKNGTTSLNRKQKTNICEKLSTLVTGKDLATNEMDTLKTKNLNSSKQNIHHVNARLLPKLPNAPTSFILF